MNILIMSWRDIKHPLAGGAEQVMHEHAKGWIKAGHQVTHFSSMMPGLKKNEEIDQVKIIRRGYQYLGVQITGFIYYINHRNQYDLVVDEFHGLPFFTPLYVRKPKLAVIQEATRQVWLLNPLPVPLNWLIGVIGFLFEPLFFIPYRKTKFMTGSQSAKADVVKIGIPKNQIFVVPHGVLIAKPKPFPTKEKIKTISFLGILSKDKGIEDAIKCFSILNQSGQYQFWVIGRPETEEYGARITRLTRQLKLNKKVKFWGFVDQVTKFKLLAKSHLLINPSAHEGWGLVNIEANAMGTPVVSYNSAGLVDSIKNDKSGVICKNNSPENLAEEILNILSSDSKYRNLILGAKKWSRNFHWEVSRKKSLKLLLTIQNS